MLRQFTSILFFIVLVAAFGAAHAEEDGPALSFGGGYTGKADVGDHDGSVSVTHFQAGASWRGLGLSYGLDAYSWDKLSDLPFGGGRKPWDRLHCLDLSYSMDDNPWGDFGYFAFASGGAAYEEELGGWNGGIGGGLNWQATDTLSLGLGVAVGADVRGVHLGPLVSVNWDGREDGAGPFVFLGMPSTQVGYSFSRALALRLAYECQDEIYRLRDDSPVIRDGYMRVRGQKLGLFADWSPLESLTLTGGVGWEFDRRFESYDRKGNKSSRYGVDSAPGISCDLNWTF